MRNKKNEPVPSVLQEVFHYLAEEMDAALVGADFVHAGVEQATMLLKEVALEAEADKRRLQRAGVVMGTLVHVLERAKLSEEARLFGARLVLQEARHNGEGCYKTNATLAKDSGISVRKAQRLKAELLGVGVIREIDELPPVEGHRYAPATIYVIWRDERGAVLQELDAAFAIKGDPAGWANEGGSVKNDIPRAKNDRKGFNSFNTNIKPILVLKAEGQEQPPAQMALAGVEQPAPAQKKKTRPQPTKELQAFRASEKMLFDMVNANRRARGMNRRGAHFDTLEQKQEYYELSQPYGSLEALKPALERAFARGVYTVKDLLPVLRAQANGARRANGHTPPAPPPRKIASAEEIRAHLRRVKEREVSAEEAALWEELNHKFPVRATTP